MTTGRQDDEARARAYVDEILKINAEYGTGGAVSEDEYLRAVQGSLDVFKGLRHRTAPSSRPAPRR